MFSFSEEQIQVITEYLDLLVRRLIEKITIYDNKAVIEFKSGIQSEVEISKEFLLARIKLWAFCIFYCIM